MTEQTVPPPRTIAEGRVLTLTEWDRVEFALRLYGRGVRHKHQQIKAIREYSNGIDFKDAQDTYQLALEILAASVKEAAPRIAGEVLHVLFGAISDKQARPGERIRGAEVIMRLFGLDAPQKHVLTGATGGPPVSLSFDPASASPDELQELIRSLAGSSGGTPASTSNPPLPGGSSLARARLPDGSNGHGSNGNGHH